MLRRWREREADWLDRFGARLGLPLFSEIASGPPIQKANSDFPVFNHQTIGLYISTGAL